MKEKLEIILGYAQDRFASLPEERAEFARNQLAITPEDRAYIDIKLGRVVADEVLRMQREQHSNGGINPAANDELYPDGVDSDINLDALEIILANHIVWRKNK